MDSQFKYFVRLGKQKKTMGLVSKKIAISNDIMVLSHKFDRLHVFTDRIRGLLLLTIKQTKKTRDSNHEKLDIHFTTVLL